MRKATPLQNTSIELLSYGELKKLAENLKITFLAENPNTNDLICAIEEVLGDNVCGNLFELIYPKPVGVRRLTPVTNTCIVSDACDVVADEEGNLTLIQTVGVIDLDEEVEGEELV